MEDKGEIIESVEETFDGFLKLPNEARRPEGRDQFNV